MLAALVHPSASRSLTTSNTLASATQGQLGRLQGAVPLSCLAPGSQKEALNSSLPNRPPWSTRTTKRVREQPSVCSQSLCPSAKTTRSDSYPSRCAANIKSCQSSSADPRRPPSNASQRVSAKAYSTSRRISSDWPTTRPTANQLRLKLSPPAHSNRIKAPIPNSTGIRWPRDQYAAKPSARKTKVTA